MKENNIGASRLNKNNVKIVWKTLEGKYLLRFIMIVKMMRQKRHIYLFI